MLRPELREREHRTGAVRRSLRGIRATAASRMPGRQRAAIFLILGGVWFSGAWWLVLDQFFSRRGQFGPIPHPWEPALLMLHGIAAIAGLYLLGWVTARHVARWWPARLRRASGITLSAFLMLLAVSGFALFFVSEDRAQHALALCHDVLGVAVTVFGIQHWFFARRRDLRNMPKS